MLDSLAYGSEDLKISYLDSGYLARVEQGVPGHESEVALICIQGV